MSHNPHHLTAAELAERDKPPVPRAPMDLAHEAYEAYVQFAESQGKAPLLDRDAYVQGYVKAHFEGFILPK